MEAQHSELNRLLAAAVVSPGFPELLLTNPAKAIEDGWNGETFALTSAERQLVCSIKATTLREFARQVVELTHQADEDV